MNNKEITIYIRKVKIGIESYTMVFIPLKPGMMNNCYLFQLSESPFLNNSSLDRITEELIIYYGIKKIYMDYEIGVEDFQKAFEKIANGTDPTFF